MKIDKEQLFGFILLIAGAFVTADGLTNGKFPYTVIGIILLGFSMFLFIESNGVQTRDSIVYELCEDEPDKKE